MVHGTKHHIKEDKAKHNLRQNVKKLMHSVGVDTKKLAVALDMNEKYLEAIIDGHTDIIRIGDVSEIADYFCVHPGQLLFDLHKNYEK